MTSRIEAAAIALASGCEYEARYYADEAKAALAAVDAHDRAQGIHRVSLDDATVERAARALFTIENPEADWEALPLNQWITDIYRKRTRTVLAAAVGADGE